MTLAARPAGAACTTAAHGPFLGREESPLRHWSALLGLIAVILLGVAGGPNVATAAACQPCPPDCPMMVSAESGSTASPDKSSQPGGKAERPCTQTVICQASVTAPVPTGVTLLSWLTIDDVERPSLVVLNAPSHPPDRSLRPPINL